jgi:NADPH-dependent 2,4-dienoyl-CoA reductase/sulfur reductase-like enzyme
MRRTQHLIVGGGMAGHAAAAAIREVDREAAIALVGEEPDPPYARPPLSKALWLGKQQREDVFLAPVDGLEHHAGRRVTSLDPARREVTDDRGETWRYERLLLATGGRPRTLRDDGGRVVYLRTLRDYDRIRATPGSVAVVGGGFVGSEIAAALAASGRQVTMIFPEAAIGARAYPPDLAFALTQRFANEGIRVLAGRGVAAVEAAGERTRLRTSRGEEVEADLVVAGLGIQPDARLAGAAGLATSDGIDVDERMRASAPAVYAAGDVARFPCPALGERRRVEHEDAALSTGRVAGRSMTGRDERYHGLPFFYSDLFDLGYEAVGTLDARLDTVATWRTPFREGVVYYLDGDRVRGVLLWGIFGQVDAARELIGRAAAPRREELLQAIRPEAR